MSNVPPGGGFPPPPSGPPPGGGFPPPPGGGGFPPPGDGGGYPPPGGGYGGAGGFQGATGAPVEWQERLVSGLIDYIGPWIALSVLGAILTLGSDSLIGAFVIRFGTGLLAVAWALYQGHLAGTTGQSMGMKQAGLRLVGESTGQPIGSSGGLTRNALFAAALILNALCCGILGSVLVVVDALFPLWDSKKQTLRDKIAKSIVVKA